MEGGGAGEAVEVVVAGVDVDVPAVGGGLLSGFGFGGHELGDRGRDQPVQGGGADGVGAEPDLRVDVRGCLSGEPDGGAGDPAGPPGGELAVEDLGPRLRQAVPQLEGFADVRLPDLGRAGRWRWRTRRSRTPPPAVLRDRRRGWGGRRTSRTRRRRPSRSSASPPSPRRLEKPGLGGVRCRPRPTARRRAPRRRCRARVRSWSCTKPSTAPPTLRARIPLVLLGCGELFQKVLAATTAVDPSVARGQGLGARPRTSTDAAATALVVEALRTFRGFEARRRRLRTSTNEDLDPPWRRPCVPSGVSRLRRQGAFAPQPTIAPSHLNQRPASHLNRWGDG